MLWNIRIQYQNYVYITTGCAILFLETDVSCDGEIFSVRYIKGYSTRERERRGEADRQRKGRLDSSPYITRSTEQPKLNPWKSDWSVFYLNRFVLLIVYVREIKAYCQEKNWQITLSTKATVNKLSLLSLGKTWGAPLKFNWY